VFRRLAHESAGRTDGQTDRRQTTAIATLCIASRGKNWVSENQFFKFEISAFPASSCYPPEIKEMKKALRETQTLRAAYAGGVRPLSLYQI